MIRKYKVYRNDIVYDNKKRLLGSVFEADDSCEVIKILQSNGYVKSQSQERQGQEEK